MNAHRDSITTVAATMRPHRYPGFPGAHGYSDCLPTGGWRGPSPATLATPGDGHPRGQAAILNPESQRAWVAPDCTLSALNRQT